MMTGIEIESSGWILANRGVSAHACSPHALDFVLICAMGAPFSPILLILPIEESITYVFSMAAEVVPFQSMDLFRSSLG
jgi:hypothetical protein